MKLFVNLFLYLSIILLLVLSCKKENKNKFPEVIIYEPTSTTFLSTDTILVEFTVFDEDDDILNSRIFLSNNSFSPVSDVIVLNNIKKGTKINIKYPIQQRWLPTGKYYLVIVASDKYSSSREFKELYIVTKAPELCGLIVITQNNNEYKVYITDKLNNYLLKKTHYNLLDVAFYPINNNFVFLDKLGILTFTDTLFNNLYTITNLNKHGSIYEGKIIYKYPFIYVNNANGYIYGINESFNISETNSTFFEPYFYKWINNDLVVFSKENNNINNFFFELPLKNIQYTIYEKPLDVIFFDQNQFLLITQNYSEINLYLYNKLYNTIQKLVNNSYTKYHGSVNINNNIYISLDNALYTYNLSFGSLVKIKEEELNIIKYFQQNNLIFATKNNEINIYNSYDFVKIGSITFPEDIVFYDFIIK